MSAGIAAFYLEDVDQRHSMSIASLACPDGHVPMVNEPDRFVRLGQLLDERGSGALVRGARNEEAFGAGGEQRELQDEPQGQDLRELVLDRKSVV